MRLYARRTSSNSQKVLWFLGELGLEYDFVATGGDAGGLSEPEYLAMNPNAAVPTLVDGPLALWESHAILRYLAAEHGAGDFWPETPAARSWVDRWMDWSQSQFDAAFMNLFWGHWRMPVEARNDEANQVQVDRCRRYLEILDGELARHAFVVGDNLSLADIPVGALMYRYAGLDVTADMPPHVARWYASLTERDAYQAHVMLPFDELKGRLAP
ncbi:MAG: glutathione S-transferase family protein [bacterium]|nr:glutathione S-transferase family protein [bacterium]